VISSQLSDGSLIERHSTVVLMIQAPATITERDFPPIGIESMQVSITKPKGQLEERIAKATKGEEIVICRRGKPMVRPTHGSGAQRSWF
jgi:hypothetical protein